MNSDMILAAIDSELALLKQTRAVLGGEAVVQPEKGKAAKPRKRKHKISPEGRKRITEAAKRRWTAQRKAAN